MGISRELCGRDHPSRRPLRGLLRMGATARSPHGEERRGATRLESWRHARTAVRYAVLAAALTTFASTASAQTTLRIGLAEDPDILDPTMARTYVGRIVFASICDKLFDIDEKLKIVPQLATGYTISEDGKEITIKLRAGVLFHDGEKFDAEAVKFTLERHLTAKGSFRRSEIASIDKIEVVDPLTVKLILKAPSAPLIAAFT